MGHHAIDFVWLSNVFPFIGGSPILSQEYVFIDRWQYHLRGWGSFLKILVWFWNKKSQQVSNRLEFYCFLLNTNNLHLFSLSCIEPRWLHQNYSPTDQNTITSGSWRFLHWFSTLNRSWTFASNPASFSGRVLKENQDRDEAFISSSTSEAKKAEMNNAEFWVSDKNCMALHSMYTSGSQPGVHGKFVVGTQNFKTHPK